METKSKSNIKKNLFFNTVNQVIVVLSPLVLTPKLSRLFGLDYLGIKDFSFSIVYYFAVFGVLGLDMYGQRQIAIEKDDIEARSKSFFTIFSARFLLCFICLCVYISLIPFIASSPFEKKVFCCWIFYLVREMINPVWFLQGMEFFGIISGFSIFSQIAYLFCSFIFITEKIQLPIYILFYTCIPLAISISYFPIVFRNVKKTHISFSLIFSAVKESVVYFIPTIATAIYSMVDKTMLGFFDSSKISNGLYDSAEKIVKVALTMTTASFTIIRTRMSYLFGKKDMEQYRTVSKSFMSLSMLLCWPIMFGIIGIAADFVPVFFGNGFEKVVPLCCLFSLVVPCLTISGLLQAIYIFPFGLQKKMDYYYILIVSVNFVLNLILISFFSTTGAIIATLSAEFLLALILLLKARKQIEVSYIFTGSWKYFISAIGMLLCMKYVSSLFEGASVKSLCIVFISAVICYFTLCILFRDDFLLEQIKSTVKKISKQDRK